MNTTTFFVIRITNGPDAGKYLHYYSLVTKYCLTENIWEAVTYVNVTRNGNARFGANFQWMSDRLTADGYTFETVEIGDISAAEATKRRLIHSLSAPIYQAIDCIENGDTTYAKLILENIQRQLAQAKAGDL